MNIVKGVADLIRRTSSGQSGESSGLQAQKFSPPGPKIRFSDAGDEAIVNTLWERYQNVDDKAEKKRLLHVFIKQFVVAFNDWEPINSGILLESTSVENFSSADDVVIGCSAGHPVEVIRVLVDEVTQLSSLVTELSTSILQSPTELTGAATKSYITSEGFLILDASKIIVRSLYNCRVFGYYGGIQKLTALMKGAVVQLKTISGALSADESLSDFAVEKIKLLQQILIYVVSIFYVFIDLGSNIDKKDELFCSLVGFISRADAAISSSNSSKVLSTEARLHWRQKAIVSVMEAGGLNWLVELLRLCRRFSLKELLMDDSLQYLSLKILSLALSANPRGQNHFKSIGGLEVLLDGLGFPSNYATTYTKFVLTNGFRDDKPLQKIFELHILALEVLREAVFGNINNLQFLCENGRVQKFANSFCSPAFVLQDLRQGEVFAVRQAVSVSGLDIHKNENYMKSDPAMASAGLPPSASFSHFWNDYVLMLSKSLCSFLIIPGASKSLNIQPSSGRLPLPVSSTYCELSIKWVMRVLFTIFPCIKACSNHNDLPSYLRVFVTILQNTVLSAFRNLLSTSPMSLEVFREEGIWDLVFSENFFYFESASEENTGQIFAYNQKSEFLSASSSTIDTPEVNGVNSLQMEIMSFVEFTATSTGNTHNMPELSALLDALEHSACNPEIAGLLVRSLVSILQLSPEKTIDSCKTLNAVSRVLQVACVHAQECIRSGSMDSSSVISGLEVSESVPDQQKCNSQGTMQNWFGCMKMCMEFFTKFFASAEDTKSFILHSSASIDCLFDLFWIEGLRDDVLRHILDLMKIIPFSEEDKKAKLQLCSKYLEMFTQIKEREKFFVDLSIDMLAGMRDMLVANQAYYQALFRDGECFLHVVSLLNSDLDEENGERLVLNVLQTLTRLLANNDTSKAAFRALAGKGYQTLQSLLLEFCQCHSSESLLDVLLDMLVDGKFDIKISPIIKNEDVIILYLIVLQKSSESLQHHGLDVFQQLLRDSISNRASCVRAGMLDFLLNWFCQEDNDSVIFQIAQLIQAIGGHSISGKDIRKIFALLRSEKVGMRRQYCSVLLTSLLSMLHEKGPTAFFDLDGIDSGIILKTPLQWPLNKGFSFSCWLRIENFPRNGTMGLFCFLTENGRGSLAVISKEKLTYESINLKRQRSDLHVKLVRRRWHFLCITHSIGRAFSGGSLLRCYLDGDLVSSERCRYAKISEPLTSCMIGAKLKMPHYEDNALTFESIRDSCPFFGQIGPVYLFNDAISSEQVQSIYSLGPSYMYSFLDNEALPLSGDKIPSGILDAKDGLASRIIFGLNAQASVGRMLFNVSPIMNHALDKNSFEASVIGGTQLCSRRMLQQIIYCVGGVSVLFPLITQCCNFENGVEESEKTPLTQSTRECVMGEVIELIASLLDENVANQQQMHIVSGFSVLGFLLQSVPPQQLNLETLSALKHLFNVVSNSGLAELLVEEAISSIFLNPLIWVYTVYKVQRELYMFLIQQFDNDPRLLRSLCRLPRVLDIIHQFYCDNVKSRLFIGNNLLQHPVSKKVIGERPSKEETHKIRLLLLSLGEMSLRQNIAAGDIKALIAFFETSQDMTCIEDVLHMIIRAVSQKPLLASFLEQVNIINGCQVFVNLLQREYESIRLLSLQFLGRLLVGLPSEKKGSRFFNLPLGRSKSISENHRKIRMQPIFLSISDRLFSFPRTENLCATLFDVLLGGASPKQVLQRHSHLEKVKSKASSSHFLLPQMLPLIFRYLTGCEDTVARIRIIRDILDLLDSNASNIEAFMEYGWNALLTSSLKLGVLKDKNVKLPNHDNSKRDELLVVRNLFSLVLCHYLHSVKGGWQQLEETVNFLVMHSEEGGNSYRFFLRDIYEDVIQNLVDLSAAENIFISQPCRDNTLYLLKLIDEMLISEIDKELPLLGSESDFHLDLEMECHKEYSSALKDVLIGEADEQTSRKSQNFMQPIPCDDTIEEKWWNLYDNLWVVISKMNGKGPSNVLPKSSSFAGPSLGQRARGLVESLNIPAAEVAAVVVSGGIGNALTAKPNKSVDKAMILRGERCPRIIYHLVILYLCKSSLEKASRCVQQFTSLLPCLLTADDEQSKSRLQLIIWVLLFVRSQYGMLDDGARFHLLSHLIRETVNIGKSMLATSLVSRDDTLDPNYNSKDAGSIQNLIQKDRVLAAISDEANYTKISKADRTQQIQELHTRIDENTTLESTSKLALEDEIQNTLNSILSSDDSRRSEFQLTYEEEQQNVAEKWIHMFRSLIDERGPWSTNPFPNCVVTHWKLDKTEDTWRRRLKLRQNYHFDEILCNPPSATASGVVSPLNESNPGSVGNIPEQMKQLLLKGIRKITDEGTFDTNETNSEISGPNTSIPPDNLDGQSSSDLLKDNSDRKDVVHDRRDTSSSPETEASEVLVSIPCVLVTPKRKLAGHLAVMKNVLHFFAQFLVEGTGGSSVFRNFDALSNSDLTKSVQKQRSMKWPASDMDLQKGITVGNVEVINGNGPVKLMRCVKRHRRWSMAKIKAVHWTRYLLRYTAIEIFFSGSVSPVFLNFASLKDAKDIGNLIVATRNEYLFPKGSGRDKTGPINFVDRRVAQEMAETARESWRRRDITNFEYLMILNTLAGRSYNDLTQYPVFPWVLADYTSEVLDYNKSSTFRDLSKPVGALDSKRFEVFEDRYRSFCDPDIPSFYYGSHYSSMGIVLYYLLRLEPFTSLHRNLQGGKFDHADRLFQSIEGTFRNCLTNTSDVKELIPEFFYMPEFLLNSNSYHLGVRQDGEPIGDVFLPPWSKGSPEEFIRRNREALESEYVSSNLHHWIDLVFGYKQRGKPAVEAANIFYYLTYEGAVDLETTEDDLQRAAIEDQIANFGQTPIQMFRKKHPRRGPPIPIARPLYFAPDSISLTSIVPNTSHSSSPILYVGLMDSNVILVNEGLNLSVKTWLSTQLQSGGNFTFSGSQDPFFGVGSEMLSPRKIGIPVPEYVELGEQCFATMQTPSENFLISCGNWENSFQVISLSDGRMVQSIRQHKDVVSCIAVTSDGSILATGSYDTTVMVWEVFRGKTEKRIRNSQSELPRKNYVIVETPSHILCGHDDIITCLYVSHELDIIISGSKDGTCVFHTLREGRYVRSLRHPSGCPISKLVVSQHGQIVIYADDDLSLHLYSINGKHLAASESNGRLNTIQLSKCGEFLVGAGDQGQIVVRSINTLEVVKKYQGVGKVLTSLTVTPEECFLVGTKDGSLLVYSIENPQLRKMSHSKNMKSKT